MHSNSGKEQQLSVLYSGSACHILQLNCDKQPSINRTSLNPCLCRPTLNSGLCMCKCVDMCAYIQVCQGGLEKGVRCATGAQVAGYCMRSHMSAGNSSLTAQPSLQPLSQHNLKFSIRQQKIKCATYRLLRKISKFPEEPHNLHL